MDAVKTELQTLAFAQLEPEAYDTIQARLNFLRGQGADVIEEVRARTCAASASDAGVAGDRGDRAGEVARSRSGRRCSGATWRSSSCPTSWRSASWCRRARPATWRWARCTPPIQVIAGRFKDYISTPKSNGYQSLHTGVTLREPRNQKIEVQIRTHEMHDVAENGVAAHWLYKQPDAMPPQDLQQFRWVQDLLEILENSAAPDEFLENTKLELYDDQVFCFTPKGAADPAAARRDAGRFRLCGAQPGRRHLRRRQDQRPADAAALPVAERRPGRDHDLPRRHAVAAMGAVRRHRQGARAHPPLRAPAAARSSTCDAGRAELAKAFRQAGRRRLGEGAGAGAEGAEARQRWKTCTSPSATATSAPKDVVHAAYPELRQTPRAPRMVPAAAAAPGRARRPGRRVRCRSPAWCPAWPITSPAAAIRCRATAIVGIVTTGKGVTIHARDCQTLEGFAATPERFIDVGLEPRRRRAAARRRAHRADQRDRRQRARARWPTITNASPSRTG